MTEVRAAALTNYDQVARFVGLDPDAMLREFGLHPAMRADPDHPLPVKTVSALLEESARRSGCPHFGLLLAETRSLGSLGPLGLVLKHQPTVGDVLAALVRLQDLVGSAVQLTLEPLDDDMLFRTDVVGTSTGRQCVDALMAIICRAVGGVLGRAWTPEAVHFAYPPPPDFAPYRRLFGCALRFSNTFNGFVFSQAALRVENSAGDADLAMQAERLARLETPAYAGAGTPERAKRALRLLLPQGHGTLERVATNLGITPRSLQRALEREGMGFGQVLNEVRRELAQRYLSIPSHQVTAIAEMTGYRSPSAFSRWFCTEFGAPPAAWRAQAREPAVPAGNPAAADQNPFPDVAHPV